VGSSHWLVYDAVETKAEIASPSHVLLQARDSLPLRLKTKAAVGLFFA
jgi:hypothetical protein